MDRQAFAKAINDAANSLDSHTGRYCRPVYLIVGSKVAAAIREFDNFHAVEERPLGGHLTLIGYMRRRYCVILDDELVASFARLVTLGEEGLAGKEISLGQCTQVGFVTQMTGDVMPDGYDENDL